MIESERLIIRNWIESDIEPYCKIASDPYTMRFIGNGKAQDTSVARQYVKDCMEHYNLFGWSRFAVVEKKSNTFIGFCGFKKYRGKIDFGWRYGKEHWGNGYGFEAAKEVLNLGLHTYNFPKIVCVVYQENVASIRIIEKLGMKFEKDILLNGFKSLEYSITNKNTP